jgi:hypothetical protein
MAQNIIEIPRCELFWVHFMSAQSFDEGQPLCITDDSLPPENQAPLMITAALWSA